MSISERDRLDLEESKLTRKEKRNLKKENNELRKRVNSLQNDLESINIERDFSEARISDDFLVLNNVLGLKTEYYKKVVFEYNRYLSEKKTIVSDEEIKEKTRSIVEETMRSISSRYVNYLVFKYYGTIENMISIYVDKVYLDLFEFSSEYNKIVTSTKGR